MYNPLLDKDFIYKLNQYKHKEIYVKIISLDFSEQPIEEISGRTNSGSINLDGNSAVRRTCSLSFVAKDLIINEFNWAVSNKFKLEIGLKNVIDNKYPDIIWFKQGVYVIGSFNASFTNNNYTVSITGKDKMCLLNGDIGGNLPSSIDFGKIDSYNIDYNKVDFKDYFKEYEANKYYIKNQEGQYILAQGEYDSTQVYYTKNILLEQTELSLKDIIRESVHTYGKEPYHNIIINDLDDYGLELLEYRGDVAMYALYDEDEGIYSNMAWENQIKDIKVKLVSSSEEKSILECKMNTGIDKFNEERDIFTMNDKEKKYSLTKIEFGQTVGYRHTDLIYAGELISNIGETLTSVLDKIKNMLGAFEYFYDIDGRFVFQAKKIYANQAWNTLQKFDKNPFARDAIEESPYAYSFEDINLISSFQNTPAINEIKNDYSVWGVRKTASGAEVPIHARFAIHKKPEYYKNWKDQIFVSKEYKENVENAFIHDWRELIYQMAEDYFAHNQEIDFQNKISERNKDYYPTGETGYEAFYTDIQGFWRELYNPEPEIKYNSTGGKYVEKKFYLAKIETKEDFEKNIYYEFLDNKFIVASGNFNPEKDYYTTEQSLATEDNYRVQYIWEPYNTKSDFICNYFLKPESEEESENYSSVNYYWNKNVIEAPELLNFWFDFYDGRFDMQKHSISNIGNRQKVVNDSKITSVYFRKVPQIIFIEKEAMQKQLYDRKTGYTYIILQKAFEQLFTISSQGKSAEEEVNNLLNKHAYSVENINISLIPIYNLEPNSLIHIHNEENNIDGKYQISRITLPLNYNGTMSIQATKILEPIY